MTTTKKSTNTKKTVSKKVVQKALRPGRGYDGRLTKGNTLAAKYDEAFCELIIDMGKQGASDAEMAAACGITVQTLENWIEAHPPFLCAYGLSRTYAQAWWERQARMAAFSPSADTNASLIKHALDSRFPGYGRDQKINLTVKHSTEIGESGQRALEALLRVMGREGEVIDLKAIRGGRG